MAAIIILNLFFGCFGVFSQLPEFNLSDYRWENRIILLFKNDNDSIYEKQVVELLHDKPGLVDRNLLIFSINEQFQIREILQSTKFTPKGNLWSEFNIPEKGFHILLIGKDGTIKHRSNSPITRKKLFAIIDAMPMRQAEMRRKN